MKYVHFSSKVRSFVHGMREYATKNSNYATIVQKCHFMSNTLVTHHLFLVHSRKQITWIINTVIALFEKTSTDCGDLEAIV